MPNEFFLNLQKLSTSHPEHVEVLIDEDGEVEIEIEYDFFMENISKILKFTDEDD